MRLFFAIDFPEAIKEKLISDLKPLKNNYPGLKWIKKQSLHLTIKFIGEESQAKTREISKIAKNVFSHLETFQLSTKSLGFFPNKKRPRVFFLALNNPDQLFDTVTSLEEGLDSVGIEKENRKFLPHITLARIKNLHLQPEQISELENFKYTPFSLFIDEIILMQSTLTPGGARYTPVQKFSLRTI
jgi:2'-5' RNA ligase